MFKSKIDNLRLSTGGAIDRTEVLEFSFNGQTLSGFQGDTVASALAANGIKLLARSFKYHRPRGLYSAGPEEPNALLSIEIGGRTEVNARTTMVALQQGMRLRSQNCSPCVNFDFLAINDKLSALLSAGFYYKTFIWPGLKGWMFYENIIRKAAGMGNTGLQADNAKYEHIHLHCDLLIVGAGIAGVNAALAAANGGLDVILVEQHQAIGGRLCEHPQHVIWLHRAEQEISDHKNVRLMTQTTAFGAYDNQIYTLLARNTASPIILEQLFEVNAKHCITTTGAIERPLVFANNDLPGIQLAGAAQTYLHRYATLPGREIVIFCNNNSAYQVAADLLDAGAKVTALVEIRAQEEVKLDAPLRNKIQSSAIQLHYNTAVSCAKGNKRVRSVALKPTDSFTTRSSSTQPMILQCDTLLVSGGWSPTAHLHSQSGGKLKYDAAVAALIPIQSSSEIFSVGAAAGDFSVSNTAKSAWKLGLNLAESNDAQPSWLMINHSENAYQISPVWSVAGRGKAFVDLQHDVSTADIALAAREGYQSVEHLKRYTTLGMGTDQGKLSNVNALALMAEQLGQSIDQTGTTRFRPPYTPVTVGAWGGNETGHHLTPRRRTPMQQWHVDNGGYFNISGPWQRATDYRRQGESKKAAVIREVTHVRAQAGLVDVSTLGKIRLCGPDALQLLNLVYVNSFDTLNIARVRYGIMLREDGLVFDDGTVIRLATDDYLITTTTAKAPLVMRHLDRLTQVDWPELEVACTSVTDQYAAMAIAGPKSREILQGCIADIDFSDETLPFMGYACGHLGQVPIEICRISFSGELAYELYTGADYGSLCWQALLDHDTALQVYGLDALDTLRIEKGHLTGAEIDGRRSLDDIGMSAMMRGTKSFIGSALAKRFELHKSEERLQIVGLRSVDPEQALEEGMHLIEEAIDLEKHDSHGQISSVCYSPMAHSEIALAQLRNGRARVCEKLWAVSPLRNMRVEVMVVDSCFYDPKNIVPRASLTPTDQLQRPNHAMSLAAVRNGPLLNSDKKMHSAIDSIVHSQLNLYSVASWPNANNMRIDTLAKLLGFHVDDYPKPGSSIKIAGVDIFAIGPYHCWLQVDNEQSSLCINDLAKQLSSSIASVVDISHSYTKVSLRGKGLRALLSRAIDIDLRTSEFKKQQFALTRLLAVQALVHCLDVGDVDHKVATDTSNNEQFDILFNRAFALDAWQHLSEISHHLSVTEQQGKLS